MNKKLLAFDIEVLPNYFLVIMKRLDDQKSIRFEAFGSDATLELEDRKKLHRILAKHTSFGFNSLNYDLPIVNLIVSGKSCNTIYNISKQIIEQGIPYWQSYKKFDIDQRPYDHFDVKEPSPAVMISLKNYGTRVGSEKLQEFYLDPHTPITEEQVQGINDYCMNDVDVTIDLYEAIKDRIDLRISMSDQYGMDLRSKSDAQIAEAVINSELQKQGIKTYKPEYSSNYSAQYVAPAFIDFESPMLQELVEEIERLDFTLDAKGSVKMPKELANKKIKIGETIYKMGIGGLHSQEKSISVVSDDENVMRNADFTSYYPFIILNLGLYPRHLGEKFLDIYRNIVEDRIKSKARIPRIKAELKEMNEEDIRLRIKELEAELEHHETNQAGKKIQINGSFGKFGSKYSKLYSPNLLLRTTITGQLTLLMLIEQLEKHGIPVVSANTDGLEYYCPRDKVELAEAIIFDLELVTGFEMEHGEYQALHARDVNNYVAVYDGYTKAKGAYAETTLSKGRSTPIVYTAIRQYLLDGTPIQDTIYDCWDQGADMNDFASARTVKGGGEYDGEYLGKMVRWYYSTESKGCITYISNGNKVPKTDGCKPMMDLIDKPDDLDYKWYINEAIDKLKDLGVNYE